MAVVHLSGVAHAGFFLLLCRQAFEGRPVTAFDPWLTGWVFFWAALLGHFMAISRRHPKVEIC